jgi:hypothetical protein
MPRSLACAHVSNDALRGGEVAAALAAVLARPMPPAPDVGGAARAAERIVELVTRGSA